MDRELLDRINGYAQCGMMALSAGGLIGTGVATLWAGGSGALPLTAGSLQLMGAIAACTGGDLGDNDAPDVPVDGCQQMEPGGYGTLEYNDGGGWSSIPLTEATRATEIISSYIADESSGRGYAPVVSWNYTDQQQPANFTIGWYPTEAEAAAVKFRINPTQGECETEIPPGVKPLPPEATQPITYTDESTNCTYNVTLQGFAESFEGGPQSPVWLIEGANDPEVRAGGGRYGGCNFPPVLYYDDSGGGPGGPTIPPIPVTPGPGPLDWKKILENALGAAAGNLAAQAIKDLFEAKLPKSEFEFVAPCDYDGKGDQLSVIYELPEQDYQSRVVSQQAVIMEILQQHLNWKTPTCRSDEPKNPGGRYWRSLAFESEDSTDDSRRRVHKRFRYRSNAPGDVGRLYEHWRDFVWDTGPVVVSHSGSALGSPQVWAASESEGKRVIYHAAAEAGVAPDQDGEWIIGGGNNARYGVSRTVKLKNVDGTWAATARQGPSGYPDAVWTMGDP